MLYLQQPAGEAGEASLRRAPLSETAAACLERALLAAQREGQRRELHAAVEADAGFAGWLIRAAEYRLRQTINHAAEAVEWLCDGLAAELAASLVVDDSSAANQSEQRLFALAIKLASCEQELASFQRRLEHEKLESLKELAYGASHEINNPLANITARAQTLLQDEADPERRRKLAAIHRQAMRAHEMISDLMLFARPPKLTPAPCELRALVGGVVNQLGELAREAETELAFTAGDEALELVGDATQLGVAVHALIINALQAVGSGGRVWVLTGAARIGGKEWAEIAVRDNGPGISE